MIYSYQARDAHNLAFGLQRNCEDWDKLMREEYEQLSPEQQRPVAIFAPQ
jgi:hypothetical protein